MDYFRRCLEIAANSPCVKMKFGAVVVMADKIIGEGYNRPPHECIEYLCHPCIREGIKSGTQLERCAASHAEQVAIFHALRIVYDLSEATLYVAGLYPDGRKYIKEEKSFTCSFCSRIMAEAKINDVRVPTKDGEGKLTMEEYLKSSFEFATGKKEVKR